MTLQCNRKRQRNYAKPLYCIDAVLDVGPNNITIKKMLSANEELFKGHYPHHPVFPGIFLFETIQQAVVHHGDNFHGRVRPVRIKKMRFFHPLKPGDSFLCTCSMSDPSEGKMIIVHGKCHVNDTVIAKAEIVFRIEE